MSERIGSWRVRVRNKRSPSPSTLCYKLYISPLKNLMPAGVLSWPPSWVTTVNILAERRRSPLADRSERLNQVRHATLFTIKFFSFSFLLFYVTFQWEKILLFYQEIILFHFSDGHILASHFRKLFYFAFIWILCILLWCYGVKDHLVLIAGIPWYYIFNMKHYYMTFI